MEEEEGFHELNFKLKDDSFIHLVIHKHKITHVVKETPKLNYLKQKSQDERIIEEFNHMRKAPSPNNHESIDQNHLKHK
jgi:hypothetical protein